MNGNHGVRSRALPALAGAGLAAAVLAGAVLTGVSGCSTPRILWSQRVLLNGRTFSFAQIESLKDDPEAKGHRIEYKAGDFVISGDGPILVNGFELIAKEGLVILANQHLRLKTREEIHFRKDMTWTVEPGAAQPGEPQPPGPIEAVPEPEPPPAVPPVPAAKVPAAAMPAPAAPAAAPAAPAAGARKPQKAPAPAGASSAPPAKAPEGPSGGR